MLIMVWFSLRRNPRNQLKSIKPFLQLKFQTDMVIKNGVPNVHSTKPCSTSMSHSPRNTRMVRRKFGPRVEAEDNSLH